MKAILEFDKELVNAVTDEYGFDIAINDKGEKLFLLMFWSQRAKCSWAGWFSLEIKPEL